MLHPRHKGAEDVHVVIGPGAGLQRRQHPLVLRLVGPQGRALVEVDGNPEFAPDAAAGLVRSLRGAARGESPLSRDLAALMIDALHAAEAEMRSRDLAGLLSVREREVLDHVARGSRNREIASSLEISEFTVKRHVQNILQKLELPSRRAAAAFYASVGAAMRGDGGRL